MSLEWILIGCADIGITVYFRLGQCHYERIGTGICIYILNQFGMIRAAIITIETQF